MAERRVMYPNLLTVVCASCTRGRLHTGWEQYPGLSLDRLLPLPAYGVAGSTFHIGRAPGPRPGPAADSSLISTDSLPARSTTVCNYSLAPAATRICTISAVPRRRAADRSDSPLALLAFTSAPAATRIFSASVLRRQIAVYSSGLSVGPSGVHVCASSDQNSHRLRFVPPYRRVQQRIVIVVSRVHSVRTGSHTRISHFFRRGPPNRGVQEWIALVVAGIHLRALC